MNEAERMLEEAANSLANIDENMLLDKNDTDVVQQESAPPDR